MKFGIIKMLAFVVVLVILTPSVVLAQTDEASEEGLQVQILAKWTLEGTLDLALRVDGDYSGLIASMEFSSAEVGEWFTSESQVFGSGSSSVPLAVKARKLSTSGVEVALLVGGWLDLLPEARYVSHRGRSNLWYVSSALNTKYFGSECANGVAVPNPGENFQLIRDCIALLRYMPYFVGEIASPLNWSENLSIYEWEGILVSPVEIDGISVNRVTGLILPNRGLSGRPYLWGRSRSSTDDWYYTESRYIFVQDHDDLRYLKEVNLENNELRGYVDLIFRSLPYLEKLDISGNNLVWAIPATVVNLASLRELDISGNSFSGSIPDSLGYLEHLRLLKIHDPGLTDGDNVELGGCIPQSLNRSTLTIVTEKLTFCGETNSYTGYELDCRNGTAVTDPVDYEALVEDCVTLLESRDILVGQGGTALNWSPEINISNWEGVSLQSESIFSYSAGYYAYYEGELSLLRVAGLDLEGHGLRGRIPTQLSRLVPLLDLNLSDNRLSGEIPTELGNLSSLTHLRVNGNDLSGAIPAELGKLGSLRTLLLGANALSGELPDSLTELRNLEYFNISGNRLSGCVPISLVYGRIATIGELPLCTAS